MKRIFVNGKISGRKVKLVFLEDTAFGSFDLSVSVSNICSKNSIYPNHRLERIDEIRLGHFENEGQTVFLAVRYF